MAEGSIKKLTNKNFGFIKTETDKDLFFHASALQGVSFDVLHEGQKVSYTVGQSPKGPWPRTSSRSSSRSCIFSGLFPRGPEGQSHA